MVYGYFNQQLQSQFRHTLLCSKLGLRGGYCCLEVVSTSHHHRPVYVGTSLIDEYSNLIFPSFLSKVSSDILQMLVIDEDSGSNGQVTFTILNDPDNTFSLLQTGNQATLTLRAQLDYETTAHYQLTILAHDGGNPVLSSSATVEIQVTDEADSLPVFNASSYSVTLPEDTPPIAYLVTVEAVSNDSPSLAALEYFLVDGDYDGR